MPSKTNRSPFPLTLIVLAGGSSRRMKQDKTLLPVCDGTLIEYVLQQLEEHFVDTLISVSEPEKFTFLDRAIVVDEKQGCGPMMGIKSALAVSKTEKNFVIACDIPVFDFNFLERVVAEGKNSEIAIPVSPHGRMEPLFAVYSKSVLSRLENLLEKGVLSLLPLFDLCLTHTVTMDADSFKNLNTIQDYKSFIRQL